LAPELHISTVNGPTGNPKEGEKIMVSKKATRKLKKSKKLQPTKPLLSLNFTKIEQTSTPQGRG
jgi:hypothetical protein